MVPLSEVSTMHISAVKALTRPAALCFSTHVVHNTFCICENCWLSSQCKFPTQRPAPSQAFLMPQSMGLCWPRPSRPGEQTAVFSAPCRRKEAPLDHQLFSRWAGRPLAVCE